MADYSDEYGGRFVKAEHLDKPFVGVVERVEKVEVNKDDGTAKPVLYFDGRERGVVLNATRYNFMSELCKSRDTDNWIGTRVGVRRGKVNFAGKRVDCVELCQPMAEELNDAIPF
jgi:hypothetical protein